MKNKNIKIFIIIKKTKEKKTRPFHHGIDNLTATPRANPKKNRVVDESPQKSSFPKKGTPKSKLKHLNKRFFSPSSMRAAMSE